MQSLSPEAKCQALKEYCVNFINEYRRLYDNLNDGIKCGNNNATNYTNPTQVEVFWLSNPNIQFVIVTHFADRCDSEVTVNGPWVSHDFLKKAEGVLFSERWNRPMKQDERIMHLIRYSTYAEYLAPHIHRIVRVAQGMLFEPRESISAGEYLRPAGSFFPEHGWTETYRDNDIMDTDYRAKAKFVIDDIVSNALLFQNKTSDSNVSNKSNNTQGGQEEVTKLKGFGTYFFPPITMKAPRTPTIGQLLRGIDPNNNRYKFLFDDKFVTVPFDNTWVTFNEDGYISVITEKKESAVNILNTIMGIALLNGLDAAAVREQELVENGFDAETKKITGYSYSMDTIRTMQFDSRFQDITGLKYKTRRVTNDAMSEFISKASFVLKSDKLAEEIRLLVNAFTHLMDSEFPQCFIMSWAIVERKIAELWERKVSRIPDDNRRKKLINNTFQWSADHRLEMLNLDGAFSDDEYSNLNSMKSKRNDFIHKGIQIERSDANTCYELALEIVKRKFSSITAQPQQ